MANRMLRHPSDRQSMRQRRDNEGTAGDVSIDGVDVTAAVGVATTVGGD
jgi:hypothetical protein